MARTIAHTGVYRRMLLLLAVLFAVANATAAGAAAFRPSLAPLAPQTAPAQQASQPALELIGQIGGGMASTVTVSGTLAYVGESNMLAIYDVSQPATPTLQARLGFTHDIAQIVLHQDRAYVAGGNGGLHVVDVQDPRQPLALGSYLPPSLSVQQANVTDVGVVGNLAYLPVWDSHTHSRLEVVDISDPAHIVLVGKNTRSELFTPVAIQIVGSTAYVADWASRVRIYDISTPTQPKVLSTFYGGYLSASPTDLEVVGDLAYVSGGQGPMFILDVTNPLSATLRGSLPLGGNVRSIDLQGTIAYLADNETSQLHVVDVADVEQPAKLTSYQLAPTIEEARVAGQTVYVVGGEGLTTIDISTPAEPRPLGGYRVLRNVDEVAVGGGFAYVADREQDLQIVDVGDPAQPALRRQLEIPGRITGLDLQGDLLGLVTEEARLGLVDVSDPLSPTVTWWSSDVENESFGEIKLVGERAYILSLHNGMLIMDIANPAQPALLGTYKSGGSMIFSLEVQGMKAYLGSYLQSVTIVDVTNPVTPTAIYGTSLPDSPYALAAQGDMVYVTGSTQLSVLDTSGAAPQPLVSRVHYPASFSRVKLGGSLLYLADSYGGLYVFDIADPAHPKIRARYDTSWHSFDVEVEGDVAYLADDTGGLKILRVSQASFPRPVFLPQVSK